MSWTIIFFFLPSHHGYFLLQTAHLLLPVMTVRLGLLFFFPSIPLSPSLYYCTTDTPPSLLVTVLSWTSPLIPRLGQDALRTVHLLPYLLHALPSPLLYYLRVHQYLLMRTFCAPFVPVSPHCHLMYHCTFVHATRPPLTCVTPCPLYAF